MLNIGSYPMIELFFFKETGSWGVEESERPEVGKS